MEIYAPIADEYSTADRAGKVYARSEDDRAEAVFAPVYYVQYMANAMIWGRELQGMGRGAVGVQEIEFLLKIGKIDPLEAVAVLHERIAQLTELTAAWVAFNA